MIKRKKSKGKLEINDSLSFTVNIGKLSIPQYIELREVIERLTGNTLKLVISDSKTNKVLGEI